MELNHIYCGDCLEVMRGMGDNSVDLVLTDPPYGIGIAKKGTVGGQTGFKGTKLRQYGNQEWDNKIPSKEYFDEIKRISKNAILSFPYKWNVPGNIHHNIDENIIKKWTNNFKPTNTILVADRIIYIFNF